jgi:hypothetical protein
VAQLFSLDIERMNLLRVYLILVSLSLFCGCATTQRDTTAQQNKPGAWKAVGDAFISVVGGGAYDAALQNQESQHP